MPARTLPGLMWREFDVCSQQSVAGARNDEVRWVGFPSWVGTCQCFDIVGWQEGHLASKNLLHLSSELLFEKNMKVATGWPSFVWKMSSKCVQMADNSFLIVFITAVTLPVSVGLRVVTVLFSIVFLYVRCNWIWMGIVRNFVWGLQIQGPGNNVFTVTQAWNYSNWGGVPATTRAGTYSADMAKAVPLFQVVRLSM